MEISLSCLECQLNKDKKEYSFELRDDNTYSITCEDGHESIIFLESHKFELLFEMGIKAMLDGYFREAISNFAVSIERFHEFSIEVFIQSLLNRDNPTNKWKQQMIEYDKAWKIIGNQSERQLGAYTMLYLSVFNIAPGLIKPKHVEFRNKVIHKGYFPTELETMEYAREMFSYLQSKLLELKESVNDSVEYIYDRKMTEYIASEDVNGKTLVKWGELMTFKSLKPIDEIKALVFNNVIEERKYGFNSFKNRKSPFIK